MLEISWQLLVITAVIFLGLIYILNLILYRPMLKFMDDRKQSIKKDEEDLGKNAKDVGVYKAEIDRILLSARNEANSIRQAATDKAKEVAAGKIAQIKAGVEADHQIFTAGLANKKTELKLALLESLPEFKDGLAKTLAKI